MVLLTINLVTGSAAHADTWDLNIGRLCQIETVNATRVPCGQYTPNLGDVQTVHRDHVAFRSLMSELGVVFAPNVLSPAETFGYNGFTFSAEVGMTTVNPRRQTNHEIRDGSGAVVDNVAQPYWRAAKGVSDAAIANGDTTRVARELPPTVAPTLTLMVRKGLWLPVPSFELGFGVRHLFGSNMWSALVHAKLALHEGFQDLPLPSFAIRGMASRVIGTPDFNLTVAGLDFSLSKHLGIASTVNIMPYLGYQLLWIIADSLVIDATPSVDPVAQTAAANPDPLKLTQCRVADCRANFAFDAQANILRHRVFLGVRLNVYIVSFLAEYSYFAAGSVADPLPTLGSFTTTQIADKAGAQHAVNLAVALDY
ncbi:MAG: hypothetical protein H6707_15120 [Deltaproteobacteria bacterium]|nr:hypothetical protein [Deltaproteobacteria bacterium]